MQHPRQGTDTQATKPHLLQRLWGTLGLEVLWALQHPGTGGGCVFCLLGLKVPEAAVLLVPRRDSGETQVPAHHSGGLSWE